MKYKIKNQKLRNAIWWTAICFFGGLSGAVKGAMNQDFWVELIVSVLIVIVGLSVVAHLIEMPDED